MGKRILSMEEEMQGAARARAEAEARRQRALDERAEAEARRQDERALAALGQRLGRPGTAAADPERRAELEARIDRLRGEIRQREEALRSARLELRALRTPDADDWAPAAEAQAFLGFDLKRYVLLYHLARARQVGYRGPTEGPSCGAGQYRGEHLRRLKAQLDAEAAVDEPDDWAPLHFALTRLSTRSARVAAHSPLPAWRGAGVRFRTIPGPLYTTQELVNVWDLARLFDDGDLQEPSREAIYRSRVEQIARDLADTGADSSPRAPALACP